MLNVRNIWENSNISADWPGLASSVRFDEPLSAHTTFRVGGPADLFVAPETETSLGAFVTLMHGNGIPVSLVGGGSNLVISDRGIRGAVVSLERLNYIEDAGSEEGSGFAMALPGADRATAPDSAGGGAPASASVRVTAGAGAMMNALVEWSAGRGITGLERFAGLPGTVGGAAYMNARCYERSVSDVFFEARVMYFGVSGYTLITVPFSAPEWDYKKSPFQARGSTDPLALLPGDKVLVSVTFSLGRGDPERIRLEMGGYVADREAKGHFRYPSAGSMFKNNRAFGKPSGAIIDEAGLKGFRVGDAQVAPWHGNLVINAGNATASDLRTLVDEVSRRVFERTGFRLEREVIFAGDWE